MATDLSFSLASDQYTQPATRWLAQCLDRPTLARECCERNEVVMLKPVPSARLSIALIVTTGTCLSALQISPRRSHAEIEIRSHVLPSITVVALRFDNGKGNGAIDEFFVLEHHDELSLPNDFTGPGTVTYRWNAEQRRRIDVLELSIEHRGVWSIVRKSQEMMLRSSPMAGRLVRVDFLMRIVNHKMTNDEIFAFVRSQDWSTISAMR
jgi:hypothetical protein